MDFSSRRSQQGNALWFILVAIVLLGGLTVLLTRSGSSVNQSGDVEQNRIRAGQILRWAKGLEAAIEQMKLRGVSENGISFENGATATDYANPNCTVNDCMVFANGGGGQTYIKPPAGTNDGSEWVFTANNGVTLVGTDDARSGNDVMLVLRGVNDAFCKQVNRELGVGTAGVIPEESTEVEYTAYQGAFPSHVQLIAGTSGEFQNRNAGCMRNTPNSENVFYYVLLAR